MRDPINGGGFMGRNAWFCIEAPCATALVLKKSLSLLTNSFNPYDIPILLGFLEEMNSPWVLYYTQ